MNNESTIVAVLLLGVSCTDSLSISIGPSGGTAATATNGIGGTGGVVRATGGTNGNAIGGDSMRIASGGTSAPTTVNDGSRAGSATQAIGGKDSSATGVVVGTSVGGASIVGAILTAGTGGGTKGASGSTGLAPSGNSACLQSGNGKYSEPGPYRTARRDGVDLSSLLSGASPPTTFSIIYPEPLEANCPHPIVAWGNGTGVTGQGVYDFFNVNAASWGMVVIASDSSNVGSGQYHKAGIDHLLKENENPSSIFYHKLSARAGTSGHSQGGMGATVASAHPNVVAEVCVAGAGTVGAKVAFLCLTGTADMVEAQCTATYKSAPGPAFLADWEGGDHMSTETVAGYLMRDPGTLQMQRLYSGWFRCFLADDPVACAMFRGSPCGICNDSGWATIAGRNIK